MLEMKKLVALVMIVATCGTGCGAIRQYGYVLLPVGAGAGVLVGATVPVSESKGVDQSGTPTTTSASGERALAMAGLGVCGLMLGVTVFLVAILTEPDAHVEDIDTRRQREEAEADSRSAQIDRQALSEERAALQHCLQTAEKREWCYDTDHTTEDAARRDNEETQSKERARLDAQHAQEAAIVARDNARRAAAAADQAKLAAESARADAAARATRGRAVQDDIAQRAATTAQEAARKAAVATAEAEAKANRDRLAVQRQHDEERKQIAQKEAQRKADLASCVAQPAPRMRTSQTNPFMAHVQGYQSLLATAEKCPANSSSAWSDCIGKPSILWPDHPAQADHDDLQRRFNNARHFLPPGTPACALGMGIGETRQYCSNLGRTTCLSHLRENIETLTCDNSVISRVWEGEIARNDADAQRVHNDECHRRLGP